MTSTKIAPKTRRHSEDNNQVHELHLDLKNLLDDEHADEFQHDAAGQHDLARGAW